MMARNGITPYCASFSSNPTSTKSIKAFSISKIQSSNNMSFTFSFGTPATPSDVVSTEEVKVEDASATGATGAALEEDFVDDSRLKLPSGACVCVSLSLSLFCFSSFSGAVFCRFGRYVDVCGRVARWRVWIWRRGLLWGAPQQHKAVKTQP